MDYFSKPSFGYFEEKYNENQTQRLIICCLTLVVCIVYTFIHFYIGNMKIAYLCAVATLFCLGSVLSVKHIYVHVPFVTMFFIVQFFALFLVIEKLGVQGVLLTFPLMTGLYLFFGFSASAILSAVLVIWVSFAATQYLESGLSFRVQIALSLQYLLCAALGYIAEKDKQHWNSQVTTDFLTSIPNRRAIYKWLEENIHKCKANNSDLALYFIDIDKFKAINDQYGHAVGDQLLAAFSMRLRNNFRAGELSRRKGNVFIARLSGDEFVVAVRDIDVLKSLQVFKQRIIDASNSPFRIENQKIRIGLSIGVELASNCGYDHKALLDRSDKKMYIDKKLNTNKKVNMNEALKENAISK